MHPEENILDFLKTYDKDDPAHRKTYEMFKETDESVDEIASALLDSGVNIENLQSLVSTGKEDSKRIKVEDAADGFEIPGLGGDDVCLPVDKPEDRFSKYNRGIMSSDNGKNEDFKGHFNKQDNTVSVSPSNKDSIDTKNEDHYSTKTVFYQNILSIPSPSPNLAPASPEYLFPILQCKLCGLRFRDTSEMFTQHIEDHRRFTNALGEKMVLRREFFAPRIHHRTEKLDLNIEGETEEIVWEKESPICSVCGKIIKKKWEDKIENWVLEDGVKINEKEVSHRKCVY